MAYRQRKYVKVAKNRDSFDNGNPRGFRWVLSDIRHPVIIKLLLSPKSFIF